MRSPNRSQVGLRSPARTHHSAVDLQPPARACPARKYPARTYPARRYLTRSAVALLAAGTLGAGALSAGALGTVGLGDAAADPGPVSASPAQTRAMVTVVQQHLDAVQSGDQARVKALSCGNYADDLMFEPGVLAAISRATAAKNGRITATAARQATVANNLGRVTVDPVAAKPGRELPTGVRYTLDLESGAWKVCATSVPFTSLAGLGDAGWSAYAH